MAATAAVRQTIEARRRRRKKKEEAEEEEEKKRRQRGTATTAATRRTIRTTTIFVMIRKKTIRNTSWKGLTGISNLCNAKRPMISRSQLSWLKLANSMPREYQVCKWMQMTMTLTVSFASYSQCNARAMKIFQVQYPPHDHQCKAGPPSWSCGAGSAMEEAPRERPPTLGLDQDHQDQVQNSSHAQEKNGTWWNIETYSNRFQPQVKSNRCPLIWSCKILWIQKVPLYPSWSVPQPCCMGCFGRGTSAKADVAETRLNDRSFYHKYIEEYKTKTCNYFASSDPQHGIQFIPSDILSGISIWHSIWHVFWHFICHIFWHSIWHIFWHSIWHSIWNIFWHSIWHIYLAFHLACLLTFCLAYLLTFYLAYLLTFYLAFYLSYLLTFYLAYLLTFYLAFYLSYLLTFYLAYLLTFYLAYLLTFCLAYLLTFFLAFYLAFSLAFYMALFVAVEVRLRSGEAHGAQNLAGWGPEAHSSQTLAGSGPARPTAIASWQWRSGEALRSRAGRWGPAKPTAIKSWQMRSGEAHCDQELADEVRRGRRRKKEEGRIKKEEGRRRSRATNIKSKNLTTLTWQVGKNEIK